MIDEYLSDVPLSKLSAAFGDALRVLNACWITTLSEFLGALGGLERLATRPPFAMQMEGALATLDENPPIQPAADWEAYKADRRGSDATSEKMFALNAFASRDPSLIEPFPVPPLPPETFIDKPFPIRDQGNEGSCVAQAFASAVEYCGGTEIDAELTKAFFDACRRIDGIAGDGTVLSAAATLARESGMWSGERVLSPGAVSLWKAKLVGVDGAKPSPIVAAFAVFPSWLYSKAARESGKWTLPIPGEPCVGGHAALVVGYRDDSAVPGGGFFIVRNSWGEEYARESPIGKPGFALVPYEYVQRYCTEAYAGPREETKVAVDFVPKDEFERKYVRALEEDARDPDWELVYRGTPVVAHPEAPDVFRVYSPETRRAFVRNGFAWTRKRRIRNFFPAPSEELEIVVEERFNASRRFTNGLRTNLGALIGTPSPFSPGGLLSSARKFRDVAEIADLSEAVRGRLARQNGLPEDVSLSTDAPDGYRTALETSASVKVWRVDDGKRAFAVVGIWLAPIRFSPEVPPTFEAPTGEALKVALGVVDDWRRKANERFEAICESFGAFDGDWGGLEGNVESGVPYAFSTFAPDARGGRWRTKTCGTVADERTRGLVPTLRPTTLGETVANVLGVFERESRVFFGDFTVDYLAMKSGLSQSEIETALNELVENGEYEIYKTARNESAYRKRG